MIDPGLFITGGGLVVVILLIVGVIKGRRPDLADLMPIIAAVIGIVLTLLIGWGIQAYSTPNDIVSYALTGLVAGLTSVGAYEVTWDKLKKRSSSS
jgi:hypothetical protein